MYEVTVKMVQVDLGVNYRTALSFFHDSERPVSKIGRCLVMFFEDARQYNLWSRFFRIFVNKTSEQIVECLDKVATMVTNAVEDMNKKVETVVAEPVQVAVQEIPEKIADDTEKVLSVVEIGNYLHTNKKMVVAYYSGRIAIVADRDLYHREAYVSLEKISQRPDLQEKVSKMIVKLLKKSL